MQFYEPFHDYDRPIFAIPGNHDGMVFGQGSSAPQVPTLDAFLTNFCAAAATTSPDSGELSRTTMTQPGVYFALDAPFVSIIGLYTNVFDNGPGVVSSQGGHYPLGNDQLAFLTEQLTRLKPLRDNLERAVILATHHPPLSTDSKHGGSTGMMDDIDACCTKADLWPDLLLSGHSHLYQRFACVINGKETLHIVSGSGGYAATAPKALPIRSHHGRRSYIGHRSDCGCWPSYSGGSTRTLTVTFKTADVQGVAVKDTVQVDLQSDKILAGLHESSGHKTSSKGHGGPCKKATKRKPKGWCFEGRFHERQNPWSCPLACLLGPAARETS